MPERTVAERRALEPAAEPVAGPRLELCDLRLSRPGRDGALPVLAGVSLRAEPGELVALVGPSGCGKSTLLSAVAGLLEPDGGEIVIEGKPARDRLGRLTLMPQRDALLPWRTVVANVALGPALAGVPRREALVQARAALHRYGLAGFEDHYPHALSGGMRQRVALARALLGGRRGWLLDEPFGALDALTRADLQGLLATVWAERRPTVLLVTHDVDEALLLADRILVMTPRPTAVAGEVAVDLPRPRSLETTALPAFGALKGQVIDALRRGGALS